MKKSLIFLCLLAKVASCSRRTDSKKTFAKGPPVDIMIDDLLMQKLSLGPPASSSEEPTLAIIRKSIPSKMSPRKQDRNLERLDDGFIRVFMKKQKTCHKIGSLIHKCIKAGEIQSDTKSKRQQHGKVPEKQIKSRRGKKRRMRVTNKKTLIEDQNDAAITESKHSQVQTDKTLMMSKKQKRIIGPNTSFTADFAGSRQLIANPPTLHKTSSGSLETADPLTAQQNINIFSLMKGLNSGTLEPIPQIQRAYANDEAS